ncbi:hypothetical protein [Streptomyces sp. NBRC 109706]|uniref:hypothetical protein n=1 Tax=Streptomyces sp. NBRC 109706 TaxID=1550035 RepID=UPI000A506B84|nr:hypothetical protein [Streptomyces sp. NBRC 109706]
MAPHFGPWDGQWPQDLGRLRERRASPLLTLRLAALATDEIAGPRLAYGPALARVAGELDIGVSVDAVLGASSSHAVRAWAGQGPLGPRVTLIHATGLTDAQLGLDTTIPAVDEALAAGVRPGLSTDVEVALAGDMFTQMRTPHNRAAHACRTRRVRHRRTPDRIGVRDVLGFATLQRAHQRSGRGDRFAHPGQEGRPAGDHRRGSQQHAARRPGRHRGPMVAALVRWRFLCRPLHVAARGSALRFPHVSARPWNAGASRGARGRQWARELHLGVVWRVEDVHQALVPLDPVDAECAVGGRNLNARVGQDEGPGSTIPERQRTTSNVASARSKPGGAWPLRYDMDPANYQAGLELRAVLLWNRSLRPTR